MFSLAYLSVKGVDQDVCQRLHAGNVCSFLIDRRLNLRTFGSQLLQLSKKVSDLGYLELAGTIVS